jgi:hypothetical protein
MAESQPRVSAAAGTAPAAQGGSSSAAAAMFWSRALAILDGDEPGTLASKLRAYEIVFVAVLVTEYWARAIPKWGALSGIYVVSLALASVLGPLALWWPARRLAFAGLALTHVVVLWREFPAAGNHAYLELILCALAAFLDPRRTDEQTLYVRSVRWITCVVLFYGGVQKAVHGYYTRGQFLAYSLGATPWFGTVFRLLMPADEFARLAAFKGQVGDGPYLVDHTAFVALSHVVYLIEIALVPLLLVLRTRVLGVLGAVAFVAAIEIGAREIFFGLVYVNMLLVFLPGDQHRKLIPAFAAVLAVLMLSRLGVLPEMVFY